MAILFELWNMAKNELESLFTDTIFGHEALFLTATFGAPQALNNF